MHYLAHLALPAIAALLIALSETAPGLSHAWFIAAAEKLASLYMILATPHWIWAALSGYFDAATTTSAGGFVGLHFLLVVVWLLVAQSNESHAANGWLIYLLGAPVFIALGAAAGRFVASWKSRQTT